MADSALRGARSKFTVVRDGERWGIPTGAAASTHIVKPGIAGLAHSELGEHLTMSVLRRAGILVAGTEYRYFDDQGALIVTRFDRVRAGAGQIVRVHSQDFCQALGLDPADKYQNEGGSGVLGIVRMLRRSPPQTHRRRMQVASSMRRRRTGCWAPPTPMRRTTR